jgi:hypothetical protein
MGDITVPLQLNRLTMKMKKVLFKSISVLSVLFMLSFTSCELMGCYSCTRTNDKGKEEKQGTCSTDTADQLRNEGWTCDGGW